VREEEGKGREKRARTYETLSSVHSDASEGVLSEMLGDLENESSSREVDDLKGVENGGEVL